MPTTRMPTEDELDAASVGWADYAATLHPETSEDELEDARMAFLAGWWYRHTH